MANQNRPIVGRDSRISPLGSKPSEPDEDAMLRREAKQIAPSNEKLRSLIGKYQPEPGIYGDDEELAV